MSATQEMHLRLLPSPKTAAARISTAKWITIAVATLCTFGVIMVGSASSVISMTLYGSPWSIFRKELLWMIVGAIVFFFCIRLDYRRWRRGIPALLLVTFLLLLIVLVPGIGVSSGGSSRWIGYGLLRIQPSELMKLALALFGAHFLEIRQEAGVPLKRMLGPLSLVTGSAVLLVVVQPDLGTAMVLLVILLMMLVAAGVPSRVLIWGVAIVTFGVTMAALAMPYRRARLTSFWNPWAHASSTGYQVVQSLIGLGSGHLVGLGLGNSREKWGLLPNAHTDFIASVVGEELGLVGILAMLVIIAFLILKGLRAAQEAPDRFSAYLAVGLVAWMGAEAIINLGAALDFLPVTGIPLPFISFGGSSLVITMAASGLLVNIARQSTLAEPTTVTSKRKVANSRQDRVRSQKRATQHKSTANSTAKSSASRRTGPGATNATKHSTRARTNSSSPQGRATSPSRSRSATTGTRQRKVR